MNSNCIITLWLKDKGNDKLQDLSFQWNLLLLSRCRRKCRLDTYIDSCMVTVSDRGQLSPPSSPTTFSHFFFSFLGCWHWFQSVSPLPALLLSLKSGALLLQRLNAAVVLHIIAVNTFSEVFCSCFWEAVTRVLLPLGSTFS